MARLRNTDVAPGTTPPGWLVITSYGQKVVAEYPTRPEAEDAAEWYQKTYGGPTLEVCRDGRSTLYGRRTPDADAAHADG